MAELPTKVYYRSADGLAVNLYTSSWATLDLEGGVSLAMSQETDFPNFGCVEITLRPSESATFSLLLRTPRWCSQAQILVNGEPEDSQAWAEILQRSDASGRTAIAPRSICLCHGGSSRAGRCRKGAWR